MLVSVYCIFFVFMKVCGTSCVGWIVMAMLPTTLRQSRLSCTINTKHHLSRYISTKCLHAWWQVDNYILCVLTICHVICGNW